MSGEGQSVGSLWTPQSIAKVGVPSIIAILSFLVFTGLLPTTLMRSLATIERVYSEQEGTKELLRELLRVSALQCQWAARTKEEAALCHSPSLGQYQALASNEYDKPDPKNGNLSFGGGGFDPE